MNCPADHINSCQRCQNVIARVLDDLLDAASDHDDTDDTEEYDDTSPDAEGAIQGLLGFRQLRRTGSSRNLDMSQSGVKTSQLQIHGQGSVKTSL